MAQVRKAVTPGAREIGLRPPKSRGTKTFHRTIMERKNDRREADPGKAPEDQNRYEKEHQQEDLQAQQVVELGFA